MISIDSVKFDFLADNELFAQRLNARWDYSYEKDFEEVWEEVMCHYYHRAFAARFGYSKRRRV